MKKLFRTLLLLCLSFVLCLSMFTFVGCKDDKNTIKVGASVTPHAEILKEAKALMKDKGYTLEIVEFDDYVLPNEAVNSGEIIANYFQHKPYLDTYNSENGTSLVSVANIHYEPFGIYGKSGITSINQLTGNIKIAIPDDGSNLARALFLLEANGFITLKPGTDFNATLNNVATKVSGLELVELEASLLPTAVKGGDVHAAVINGNYAIGAGLKISNALAQEDVASVSATTYANIICVKKGNENDPRVKALVECLQSETIKNFILNKYNGAVVAM